MVPKSKSGPGPVSVFGPVVSPGSNLGSGSVSGANAPTDILASEMKRDPAFALAASSLERCLRVRERVGSSLIAGRPGKPPGSGSFGAAVCEKESKGLVSDSLEVTRDRGETDFKGTISSGASGACVHRGATMVTASSASVACKDPRVSSGGAETAHVSAVDTCDLDEGMDDVRSLHGDSGRAGTARATAGEKGIIGLLEEPESVCSKDLAESTATDKCARPGHNSRIHCGVIRLSSNSSGVSSHACVSYLDALLAAPARAPAALTAARRVALHSAVVGLGVHEDGSSVHDACSNSWSDTGGVKGPTGRRCTKGGVSGPAEDLRPVSEVEAGVNFRPAGGGRGQVAGSLPRRQPGTGTRQVRGGAVTPSLHPEVPGIRFVSPGRGLDIRQSMGWTKVCGTARSGIWVLKGIARARMLPENLDHLRVRWISRGTYETAWVTPGHDCLCSYQYGHGAAIRPQTDDAIWRGVIGLWGRVAPLLSPWCAKREVPTGVNLNRYSGPSSKIRWHSDNESLFGSPNHPKLIVCMSLGNSVEFKVRRGRGSVPSLITLDHGDILVMDGLTQSEYVHCTACGLQGPRVNLTFRWVAQHIASCPLAGAVGCVLPSCVQGLAEPGPRGEWGWGSKWSSSWGLVLLLLILVSGLLVGILINIRREHRYSDQRPSCSVVHFPSQGCARWVGGRRWRLSRRRQSSKRASFYFPCVSFWRVLLWDFFTAGHTSSKVGAHPMLQ